MKQSTYKCLPVDDYYIIIDTNTINSKIEETNYDQTVKCVIECDDIANSDCFKVIAQSKQVHDGIPLFDMNLKYINKPKEYIVKLEMERCVEPHILTMTSKEYYIPKITNNHINILEWKEINK